MEYLEKARQFLAEIEELDKAKVETKKRMTAEFNEKLQAALTPFETKKADLEKGIAAAVATAFPSGKTVGWKSPSGEIKQATVQHTKDDTVVVLLPSGKTMSRKFTALICN